MGRFSGHVAVITGAGAGIGRAIAIQLAQEGCVLALADINAETVMETMKLCESKSNCSHSSHVVDMMQSSEIQRLVREVLEHHGRVSIVVNNAGISGVGLFDDVSPKQFDAVMQLNFHSLVNSCRSFLPHLAKESDAHLVNIASIYSIMSGPGAAAYHASKFAVRGFTECLEIEFRDTHPNIAVQCVCPSGVKTDIVTGWATNHGDKYRSSAKDVEVANEFNKMFQLWAISTTTEAATRIVEGVFHKESRILVGEDAKWIDLIVRMFPVAYKGPWMAPYYLYVAGILGRIQRTFRMGDNTFMATLGALSTYSAVKIARYARL